MSPLAPAASAPSLQGAQAKRPVRRVLHVFHSLGMGGAETWLVALLEWLAANGDRLPNEIQVEVCLTGGQPAVLDDRVQALGAKLHYLEYRGRHLAKFRREFTRLLAAGRFDAIHDHADYAAGVHLLCGLGELPAARVVHVHNPFVTLSGSLEKRVARTVGREAVKRLATTVAGTSLRILEDYGLAPRAGIAQRRCALHCGFDLTPFAANADDARARIRAEFGWNDDAIVLLFVGRLESHFNQKNPRFALDMARAIIASDGRVKALFVGAGDEPRAQIQRELADQGLGEAVRLPGIRFDVPRLMLASDLLLFPSVAEGLGMVAVEAQAAGLRVIASDTTPRECQVVPDMIEFVSLAESPEQWAHRARAMLSSRAPNRDEAREAVERSPFSIANSARALMEEYGFVARTTT